jgi:hypothetical protein
VLCVRCAVALSALCPSPLHLRLSVPPPPAAPSSQQAPNHMTDLTALLAASSHSVSSSSRRSIAGSSAQQGGGQQAAAKAAAAAAAAAAALKVPGVTGPVWGLHMKVSCLHTCWDTRQSEFRAICDCPNCFTAALAAACI